MAVRSIHLTLAALGALAFNASFATSSHADHTPQPGSAALVGSLQSELGCPGDWQPDCAATELAFQNGVWRGTFFVPAGDWEFKVALNDTWDENYGANGAPGGANIGLSVAEGANITFIYDHETHVISNDAPLVQPSSVTVAGSLQSELGCSGDWQPDCSATFLTFDEEDGVWQGVFSVPAGDYEYKAPLNGSWDENYGLNATRDGANIPLSLASDTDVKFYYDHATNWITSNQNSVIAVAPGNFQSELGCSGDWQPWCLQSWLQDLDGDGLYTFSTRSIPAGDYEVKVALNESWDVNYGAGGVQNGPNIPFSVPNDGDLVVFSYDPNTNVLTVGGELPKGDLQLAEAYWLAEDVIAWNVPYDAQVRLHHSDEAALAITADGVTGGDSIGLTRDGVVGGAIADKFRHLTGLPVYRIASEDVSLVPAILRQQFAVAATDQEGAPIDATGVQPPGVLDDLYTYGGALGVSFASNGAPTLGVWAPTARSVKLHLFDSADPNAPPSQVLPMTRDDEFGVWSIEGETGWNRKYYLYEVDVYVRSTGQFETNLVTDPYSLSLSMDSKRTQIVNLDDRDLRPPAFAQMRKPRLDAPEDAAIYELHVRDFSMSDPRVPENERGTFAAFGRQGSNGMRHLRRLARAGLTHVHLLPAFDCATIPEDRSTHADPGDLSGFAPDSDQQQAAIDPIRDQDGFNWCYDPFHYTAPEGSYSTDPDGPERIYEFREMVTGLNRAGLRVVMDVVYNHTSGSGQGEKSVLDRIVPDYYHRLNASGFIETSSCCANTATEHAMMEKLMLDSLRTWAVDYKVDGFRFDLMGHHSRANIENARDMLNALTLGADGVDGEAIYLYGEGWNFGEVANDARFVQATQINMGDNTGVGTFNDRIRDGVRGGGPFDTGVDHVRRQGFINGLFTDPNAENSGSAGEREELLRLTDWVRIGLAGSIADFEFEDRFGNIVRAGDVDYPGQGGAGYTSDPQEIINYAAAHDNETLFDINQYKLPRATSAEDRVRMVNLGNSIIALSQGVPFFHAGQDMLRSKSMDRNSFNSGDWFNILDFTFTDNGWGRGLPPFGDNSGNWDEQRDLLGDASIDVDESFMDDAARHMRAMLRIRNSLDVFRLQTGDEVNDSVAFHNTGPDQIPGVIAMSLSGSGGMEAVVVFNASTEAHTVTIAECLGETFNLHPVLRLSRDPVVRGSTFDPATGAFTTPARTTAVFVARGAILRQLNWKDEER